MALKINEIRLDGIIYKSGDQITCILNGNSIDDARIYFSRRSKDYNQFWICHNCSSAVGDISVEMFGYKYSWSVLYSQGVIQDEGGVKLLSRLDFNMKNWKMDPELYTFFNINFTKELFYFKVEIPVFKEYTNYSISKNDGCIILKSNTKEMEIRLGRFIRQISNKLSDLVVDNAILEKYKITDKAIEAIHNKYVSFQKNGGCFLEILSGEEILKGYTSNNYYPGNSSLNKSCMTNRHSYLKLYTENVNQVQLAVVYYDEKIVARCLVWTTIDDRKFYDRIYTSIDWSEKYISDKLKNIGYLPVSSAGILVVKLDKWKFDQYPYVDSFSSIDYETGIVCSMSMHKSMRNTDGRISG